MRLIQCSMECRKVPIERLTVVNYGARPEYYDRAACIFGVEKSSMRIFNDGFSDFVDRYDNAADPNGFNHVH
ncbi:MAG: hypothetical protein ACRD2G_09675 [Terriglobia bacterium]